MNILKVLMAAKMIESGDDIVTAITKADTCPEVDPKFHTKVAAAVRGLCSVMDISRKETSDVIYRVMNGDAAYLEELKYMSSGTIMEAVMNAMIETYDVDGVREDFSFVGWDEAAKEYSYACMILWLTDIPLPELSTIRKEYENRCWSTLAVKLHNHQQLTDVEKAAFLREASKELSSDVSLEYQDKAWVVMKSMENGMKVGISLSQLPCIHLYEEIREAFAGYQGFDVEWESCKEKVFIALSGKNSGRGLARQIEDLYIEPRVDLGYGTYQVSEYHLELWGLEEDELFEIAFENSKKIHPAKFAGMNEVLFSMMGNTGMEQEDVFGEEERMYLLSNEGGVLGASALFYEGMMEEIADRLECDKYIVLPSSKHEVIIIPEQNMPGMSPDEMKDMVTTINENEVSERDKLTDSVYMYCRENGFQKIK